MADETFDFEFELTDQRTLSALSELNGIARVLDALKEVKNDAIGFVLARSIVERECAEARIDWSQRVHRFASAQGIAIHKVSKIYTRGKASKVVVCGNYDDLVEQAES